MKKKSICTLLIVIIIVGFVKNVNASEVKIEKQEESLSEPEQETISIETEVDVLDETITAETEAGALDAAISAEAETDVSAGLEEDYPQEAKDAGFTYEQYQAMMNMPDFPDSEPVIQSKATTRATSTQQAVVNKALSYLGVPYVWGGTSPSGFDCSGLVQYVYQHAAGISLPRVTYQQEYCGQEVSLSALQLGDLLFFGTRGSTHHVAIYIGNNQFVHAPKPGDVVKVTNMSYYYPSFARRILPSESLKGYLDVVNTTVISGWAKDQGDDSRSLDVHVYIRTLTDEYVFGIPVTANVNRGDVGKHGFVYKISWKSYKAQTYKIQAIAIGNSYNMELIGSPKTFTVRSTEGNVDYSNKSKGIGGWTWKPDAPNEAIEAHLYIYDSSGKQVLGKAMAANTYRADLVNAGKGNGYHGFSYKPDWSALPKQILKVRVYSVDGSGIHPLLYEGTIDNR